MEPDPERPAAVVISAIDGMGGIGKTALAVRAAHRMAEQYPDGQLFIDLHGFTEAVDPIEPADALDRLLRAVGVPGERIPSELDERAGLWRSTLARRRMLIVLDNAVTEGQVEPLLPGAPGCLVLVTSRRRLAGLDVTHALSLDTLPARDAASLFSRTAGRGDLAADSPELAEVVELCGGLPLAIRVAASRLKSRPSWTVADLIIRLRDQERRLTELQAGSAGVGTALELSYQQLTSDQQRLYRRLCLHPGAEIEPYAAAALAGTTLGQAGRLLDQLLDDHLLQQIVPDRYVLHDLVRAHAASIAVATETESQQRAALGRLLDYYRHAASVAMGAAHPYGRAPQVPPSGTAVPDLTDPARANAWLDVELANLLAAGRYAAEHGWPEHVWHLPAILHRHLRICGRYRDAATLHQGALAATRASDNREGELDALLGLGDVHLHSSRYEQAIDYFGWALNVARAIGHRSGEADALLGFGEVDRIQGRNDQALDNFASALEIARGSGNRQTETQALLGFGELHRMQGRSEQALDYFEQGLEASRATGNHASEVDALTGAGRVYRLQTRYQRALKFFRQALEIARANGNRAGELNALLGLSDVDLQQGRVEPALDRLHQVLERVPTLGHREFERGALRLLGWAYRLQGRYELATDYYRQSLAIAQQIGDRNGQFEAWHELGQLHRVTGHPHAALSDHRQALELATDLQQPTDQARAHDGLARAHHVLDQHDQARRHWQRALEILTCLGVDYTQDEQTTADTIRAHLAELDPPQEPPSR